MSETDWTGGSGNWNAHTHWSHGLPNFSTDAVIKKNGNYTVTVDDAEQAANISLVASGVMLSETAAGSLASAGELLVSKGTAILDGANAFGAVTLDAGGTIIAGNGNAFGFATIDFAHTGALLTNDKALKLHDDLDISAGGTIAAMSGTTFTVGGAHFTWADNATLTFGSPGGGSGTVVLHGGTIAAGPNHSGSMALDKGTLADDATGFGGILDQALSFTMAAGTTLDLHGAPATVRFLEGSGSVAGGADDTLTLHAADFAGVISGAMGIEVHSTFCRLTGDSTYTGDTNLGNDESFVIGSYFYLGDGGTTGSISPSSHISFLDARLVVDHSNTYLLSNQMDGSPVISNIGTGTLVLPHANPFTGGAIIASAGTIKVEDAGAIGDCRVVLDGGAFVTTVSMTLPGQLWATYGGTLAAAAHTTLATHGGGANSIFDNEHGSGSVVFNFGTKTATGTVVWNSVTSFAVYDSYSVVVRYGTLKAGVGGITQLLDDPHATRTTINADGTLALNGHDTTVFSLHGAGKITSVGAADLTLIGGDFSGTINGGVHPIAAGTITLHGGLGNFTSLLTVHDSAVVTFAGASSHDFQLVHGGGGDTVRFTANANVGGTMSGLGSDDALDFLGIASATASATFTFNSDPASGGLLTVTDGTHMQTLHVAGDYRPVAFFTADDGHGGTEVFVAPPDSHSLAPDLIHMHDIVHGRAYTSGDGNGI